MDIPFSVIIPARLASTRLPNKMLADIGGKPLIYHTWRNACASKATKVIIACDDQQIFKACTEFGADVVLTSKDHTSGTSRLAEACRKLKLADDTLIVNVQGDEPLLPPAFINQVAQNLAEHQAASIATLAHKIDVASDLFNPNIVKVSTNKNGFALTFSRSALPWDRDDFAYSKNTLPLNFTWLRHIGIYAYTAKFVQTYAELAPCALEDCEKLEQLRALWHGYQIHVAVSKTVPSAGVDSIDDLIRVRGILS